MKFIFIYFFLIAILFGSLSVCTFSLAQGTGEEVKLREVRKEDWNKARKGISYKKNKEVKREFEESEESDGFDWKVLAPLRWLFVGLVVLGLALVVVWVITKGKLLGGEKNYDDQQNIFLSEEDIEKVEFGYLEQALQKALLQKNFKMAIRIHYLWILKVLYEKELVRWKKNKTNRAYINELAQKNVHQEQVNILRKLTIWYEKAWYGDEFLSEIDYFSIEPHFIDFRTYFEAL